MENASEIKQVISDLFANAGGHLYGGEAITQTEHALQCAQVAEDEGASPELVLAAFLHDIGHLLHDEFEEAQARGDDRFHENLGADFLSKWFGPEVTEPIRLHVPAKRYLTAVDEGYAARLSPASAHTLRIQGGPMSSKEVVEFEKNPQFQEAVRVRHWDDTGKDPEMKTAGLQHFLDYIDRV